MINRKQDKSSTVKKLAIGGAVAAAAGYLAGVLTAPKSGKETRGDIKSVAAQKRKEAEKELNELHSELDKVIADSKKRGDKISAAAQKELRDLIDKAQDTKDKAKDILGAAKEGSAEDKDLKRAIKNANSALDHLRDFLKK